MLKIELGAATLRKSPKPPQTNKTQIESSEDLPPMETLYGKCTVCSCEKFLAHQFKKGICRDCHHKHASV